MKTRRCSADPEPTVNVCLSSWRGKVMLDFGEPCRRLVLTPTEAREWAVLLTAEAEKIDVGGPKPCNVRGPEADLIRRFNALAAERDALQADLARCQAVVDDLAERIAAQSELLSVRAEKGA